MERRAYRLVVEGGEGRLEPAGDAGSDAFLAAAMAGPAPALLDYF